MRIGPEDWLLRAPFGRWGRRGAGGEGYLSVQVGATLDFVAGRVRRAPKLIQRVGLEWAFRIYTDPARLGPRYTKDAFFLFGHVARELAGRAPGAHAREPEPVKSDDL
jgi:hypothetical protein